MTLTVAPLVSALPASADPTPAAPTPISRAADWLATDYTTNCTNGANTSDYNCTNGGLADAILALSAANDIKYSRTLAQMNVAFQSQVGTWAVKSGGAAAKSIITVEALHADPTSYDGVNLVGQLDSDLTEDPTAGGFFGPGLATIALARAGQAVPQKTIDALLATQDPTSGGFGYEFGGTFTTDGDYTALGLMATNTQAASNAAAATALQKAINWSKDPTNQTTDKTGTYWNNYSPVNTTGLMLAALGEVNDPSVSTSAQSSWLQGQQLLSGAFPSQLGGTTGDPQATTQALLGLTKTGYTTASSAPAFTDVASTNQFFSQIQWVFNEQVATGWAAVPDNGSQTYQPLSSIHRDAMAAYLYRLAGSPAVSLPTTSPFSDVSSSNEYYKQIIWLWQHQITTGYPDGTFRPLDNVNRDAMAAFLYRYATLKGVDTSDFNPSQNSPFPDLKPSDQFYREITWFQAQKITTGFPDGTYRPVTPVARDAMAAFLFRLTTQVTNPGQVASAPSPSASPSSPTTSATPTATTSGTPTDSQSSGSATTTEAAPSSTATDSTTSATPATPSSTATDSSTTSASATATGTATS